jgi:hypothetical protein
MDKIISAFAQKQNDELIEQAFKDNSDFEKQELEPFYEWVDKLITGMRSQRALCENLKINGILNESNDFTDFAVNSGLAVKTYIKAYWEHDTVMYEDWQITQQGKSFIKQYYQNFKESGSWQ